MMVQGGDCKNIVVYYEWIRDACTRISAIGLVRNLVANIYMARLLTTCDGTPSAEHQQ